MEYNDISGSEPVSPEPGPSAPEKRRRYRYRSLFWPLVFIGAGVMWLLYSTGVFTGANLAVVGLVWPVFVIGIGVDLLLGRRSLLAGAVVGVVTLGIVIVLMAVGPGLGWVGSSELKTETFSTPVAGATSAQIDLGLSGYTTNIHALPAGAAGGGQLVSATLTHRGVVNFTVEGTTEKSVGLRSTDNWQWWQRIGSDTENPWDIGLAPGLPLDITVLASSGSNTLVLTGLTLRKLEVDASSGNSQVVLPGPAAASAALPEIVLQSSSGTMMVEAPDDAAFSMNLSMSSGDTRVSLGKEVSADIRFRGSSGQFILTVKTGQALRVEVRQVSSGDVKLPAGLTQVSGNGKEGVWQTPGYDDAANGVDLIIESMSSGTVKVQLG